MRETNNKSIISRYSVCAHLHSLTLEAEVKLVQGLLRHYSPLCWLPAGVSSDLVRHFAPGWHARCVVHAALLDLHTNMNVEHEIELMALKALPFTLSPHPNCQKQTHVKVKDSCPQRQKRLPKRQNAWKYAQRIGWCRAEKLRICQQDWSRSTFLQLQHALYGLSSYVTYNMWFMICRLYAASIAQAGNMLFYTPLAKALFGAPSASKSNGTALGKKFLSKCIQIAASKEGRLSIVLSDDLSWPYNLNQNEACWITRKM